MIKFSVAHATARLSGWQTTCDEAFRRAANPGISEYVLSVDTRFGCYEFDGDRAVPTSTVCLPETERKCAVPNWINAINHTTGDVIIVNSDDFSFPLYWDHRLNQAIGQRDPLVEPFVVQVSTGSQRDHELMTIQIFSRALLNHWGYALWHEYESLFVDDDYTQHAFLDPKVEVIQARDLMFEHLHFSFGKSAHDAIYAHENRAESALLGQAIFARRKIENFGI